MLVAINNDDDDDGDVAMMYISYTLLCSCTYMWLFSLPVGVSATPDWPTNGLLSHQRTYMHTYVRNAKIPLHRNVFQVVGVLLTITFNLMQIKRGKRNAKYSLQPFCGQSKTRGISA